MKEGGWGLERSQFIRKRESLVLYNQSILSDYRYGNFYLQHMEKKEESGHIWLKLLEKRLIGGKSQ
jgi:hypothetical protein